jgi:hypothetical protein
LQPVGCCHGVSLGAGVRAPEPRPGRPQGV